MKEFFEMSGLIKAEFTDERWKLLIKMHNCLPTSEESYLKMQEERNTKYNRNQGMIQKRYEYLEPKVRESLNFFRQHGILFPMSNALA